MITVYGIPSCNTVKKARAWLDAQEIPHEWVDFRQTPVSQDRIARWVDVLGAKALRNTSGRSYRALGDEKKQWTDEEWIAAFSADPMLIKRPVIEQDGAPVQVGFRGTVAMEASS